MSALDHKRTCALQEIMSALPPIATAKAIERVPRGEHVFVNDKTHYRRRRAYEPLWRDFEVKMALGGPFQNAD